jgi:hypothetical protein
MRHNKECLIGTSFWRYTHRCLDVQQLDIDVKEEPWSVLRLSVMNTD